MTAPLMLVVGADDAVAALCERAAPSRPLIRARFGATALEFIRTMRPAIVLLSPHTSSDDVNVLRAAAANCDVPLISICVGESASDLGAAIRSAIDERAARQPAHGADAGLLPLEDESSRDRRKT